MSATGLDHINILTEDMDATVAFYAAVLVLRRDRSPIEDMGGIGAWMRDAGGNAIVHLVGKDDSEAYRDYHVGAPTAALHHVAFRCEHFEETRERLDGMGITMRINDGRFGLRQINVVDPNGVNVEMNFT